MNFAKSVITVGLVGVVLVAGPTRKASAAQGATKSAAARVDDGTLRSQILANLKKSASQAVRDVDVDVNQGIVTLKGGVRTASEKARAAQLATIRDVKAVHNEIVVYPTPAKSTADKVIDATARAAHKTVSVTKDVAQKTGDKTKEIAGKTAQKTKEIVSTTGETITDAWITTKVKTKFFDETLLKESNINVDTNDRVVTLKGTVVSQAARARAAAIAGGTEGVTRVVNQLIVKSA